MSNRTISVPDDADWERWVDAAWGQRVSVSKLIRDATNAAIAAYGRGDAPKATKVAHSRTPDTTRKMEGSRPTGSGEDASAGERMGFGAQGRGGSGGGAILEGKDRFAEGSAVSDGVRDAEGVEGSPAARPLDRGRVPSSRTASAVGAENAAPASPARRPFLKQDQIRKPKK